MSRIAAVHFFLSSTKLQSFPAGKRERKKNSVLGERKPRSFPDSFHHWNITLSKGSSLWRKFVYYWAKLGDWWSHSSVGLAVWQSPWTHIRILCYCCESQCNCNAHWPDINCQVALRRFLVAEKMLIEASTKIVPKFKDIWRSQLLRKQNAQPDYTTSCTHWCRVLTVSFFSFTWDGAL